MEEPSHIDYLDSGEFESCTEFDKTITLKECVAAVKELKEGKAVGDDGVANELIKKGGEPLWRALTFMLEWIRQEEVIPETWRQERVTLLHKGGGGGGSKRELDNYRTIAIGSNIGKLFARILKKRLQMVVETRGLLGEMQYGFRRGRSTTDGLFILSPIIERAQKLGKKVYLIFLDLKKAFDKVWRTGLWEVLRSVLLEDPWSDSICCYLGMKQGCILSPILFGLYIAALEKALQNGGMGVQMGDVNIGGVVICRRSGHIV